MALADTAKLVAQLGLEDKFSKPLAGASRSLDTFQANVFQTGKGIGQIGAGVGRVAANLVKIGVVGAVAFGGALIANLRAGVEQVRLLEIATAQTEAVLKSTKGVAGETAASIRNLAEKYESLNATIDDKVIQSGENVLLTFTNIRKEAFEPALEAALNMNQALGGGEEGLQGTIIQLGKALQDPVKGITALRRVGVNFSEQQKKQIKDLISQNRLYDAQKIILAELTTEFGGSFARAGDTAAGRTAKLKDNVEDLQRSFAGPFASVLDRITGKLGAFLGEAGTVDAVTRLGSAIAGLFTDEGIDRGISLLRDGLGLLSPENLGRVGDAIHGVFDFVKNIDFETIGRGLQITAGVAKTAIDAFLSLPPEVQSIAIAALAANKLSGGLLASGIGNVAGGLLKLALGSLKTITAGNVTVLGANVTGLGGVPGVAGSAAGAGSIILKFLGLTTAIGLGAVIGNAIGKEVFFNPTVQPAVNRETSEFAKFLDRAQGDATRLQTGLDLINSGIDKLGGDNLYTRVIFGEQLDVLLGQKATLESLLAEARATGPTLTSEFRRSRATGEQLYNQALTDALRQTGEASAQAIADARLTTEVAAQKTRLDTLKALLAPLPSGIASLLLKDFSPKLTVNVATTTTVSASNVIRTLNSYTTAFGSGPGGAVSTPY